MNEHGVLLHFLESTLLWGIGQQGMEGWTCLMTNLIRTIREWALHMEKRGELAPEILESIYDHRLFKLFVPEELGGRMTSLPASLRLFEEASWIDGNLGWLITIGSGGGYFAASIKPIRLPGSTWISRSGDRRKRLSFRRCQKGGERISSQRPMEILKRKPPCHRFYGQLLYSG